jgi:hypothetical protein
MPWLADHDQRDGVALASSKAPTATTCRSAIDTGVGRPDEEAPESGASGYSREPMRRHAHALGELREHRRAPLRR